MQIIINPNFNAAYKRKKTTPHPKPRQAQDKQIENKNKYDILAQWRAISIYA